MNVADVNYPTIEGRDAASSLEKVDFSTLDFILLSLNLPVRAKIAVIAPPEKLWVRLLESGGHEVHLFEDRVDELRQYQQAARQIPSLIVSAMLGLNFTARPFDLVLCFDNLRSFTAHPSWAEKIHERVKPLGYLVYASDPDLAPASTPEGLTAFHRRAEDWLSNDFDLQGIYQESVFGLGSEPTAYLNQHKAKSSLTRTIWNLSRMAETPAAGRAVRHDFTVYQRTT